MQGAWSKPPASVGFWYQLRAWPRGGASIFPSLPQHPHSQRGHGTEGVRDLPHDLQPKQQSGDSNAHLLTLRPHLSPAPPSAKTVTKPGEVDGTQGLSSHVFNKYLL